MNKVQSRAVTPVIFCFHFGRSFLVFPFYCGRPLTFIIVVCLCPMLSHYLPPVSSFAIKVHTVLGCRRFFSQNITYQAKYRGVTNDPKAILKMVTHAIIFLLRLKNVFSVMSFHCQWKWGEATPVLFKRHHIPISTGCAGTLCILK